MSKEEAVEALKGIAKNDKKRSTERAHLEADGILLDYLWANGAEEVADAWKDTREAFDGFWYA